MRYFVSFPNINKCFSSTFILCTTSFTAIFGVTSYEATTKEEGFMLRRITEFWKDQDYETVKKEILGFLKTHENSKFCDQLRGNYGDLLIQEGNYIEALASYQKIKHASVVETFLLNQMQCFYELEQYDELISYGMPYLTKMSKELLERKDEFYFLMAEGYFRASLKISAMDKKNTYLNKALPLYEKILDSSFNDPCMFALAEIYRLQSSNDKAQSFFVELSKRHPARKEELLFHAALAQAEFDKSLAITTFSEIMKMKGEKSKDSALNRLILFFQEERYQEVVSHYSEVLNLIEEEKKSTLEYIIARSYFALKSYDKANLHLEKFLSANEGSKEERRNALLMQLSTAQFLKNEKLYKDALDELEIAFPDDKELCQAVFIHAMMLKELGRASEAEFTLAKLIENKTIFKDEEVLYLEYGLVAYNNDNWALSRKTLNDFVNKYTTSNHSPIAWKYLLSSSLNLLKANQEGKQRDYSKVEFLNDLNKIMERSEVLDTDEKLECLFLQGKLCYELEKYDVALAHLKKFIYDHSQNDHIAEAHLLTALCHHKLGNSNDMFCTHAEKALSLDKNLAKKGALHLELFNAYLTIAKDSEMHKALIEKARLHLYTALSLGEKNIKVENRLWLAHSYLSDLFSDAQVFFTDGDVPADLETFNRSFALFEEILLDPSTDALAGISADQTFLEWEVLKYANLLGRKKESQKKIRVLRSLIEQQSHNPSWNWQARQEALFEIAKTYELSGDNENAIDTYSFISTLQSNKKTFIEEYAKFSAMRLNFDRFPLNQKNENNKMIFTILSTLKDTQIQKSPASEPLHLESALEYAKIRGLISKNKDPHLKYLFFLNRITEDFTNNQDPMVEKYSHQTQEKENCTKLFAQYMKFIEAESLRIEAIIKVKDNHIALSVDLSQKAKQLLLSLKKEKVSVYLSRRIDESLNLVKKGTLF